MMCRFQKISPCRVSLGHKLKVTGRLLKLFPKTRSRCCAATKIIIKPNTNIWITDAGRGRQAKDQKNGQPSMHRLMIHLARTVVCKKLRYKENVESIHGRARNCKTHRNTSTYKKKNIIQTYKKRVNPFVANCYQVQLLNSNKRTKKTRERTLLRFTQTHTLTRCVRAHVRQK